MFLVGNWQTKMEVLRVSIPLQLHCQACSSYLAHKALQWEIWYQICHAKPESSSAGKIVMAYSILFFSLASMLVPLALSTKVSLILATT